MDKLKDYKFYIVSNDSIFEELVYTENLFGMNVENLKFDNSLVVENDSIDVYYEKNKNDIKNILINSQNYGEIHNELTKKYNKKGIELYKFIKEYDGAFDEVLFYAKYKIDIDIVIKAYEELSDIHKFLVLKFGDCGAKTYKFLKNEKIITRKTKNKWENLYNTHLIKINKIKKENKNKADFHNALVKELGMEIGKNIYKFMKENKKL